jgi:tetratricopeptide (TPR) repeat protein
MFGDPSTENGLVKGNFTTKLEKLVFVSCALVIIVHLVASFFPQSRVWGISQLHYFPLGFRLILCAAGLIILIPRVNEILVGFLTPVFTLMSKRLERINRLLKYSVVSVLSLSVFWLLKAATPLLGDGYLRAGQLKLGKFLEITEPLDFYFHLLVYRWLGLDSYSAYAVTSCIAGGAFVFLLFLLCDLWDEEGKEKLLVFSVLATMGSIQLFFGYVESYSLMYVLLMAYVLSGLRFLRGDGDFLWPCLFLLLAGGFHLAAFFALPSLFFLAFAKVRKNPRDSARGFGFARGMYLSGVIFLAVVGFYFLKMFVLKQPPGSVLIYPFGGGENVYSFFSWDHLSDFLNEQLLISPVGGLLLVGFLIFLRQSVDLKDNMVKFLFWLTLCFIAFALFVDPKLGYARDWDLFAFTGLGLTLLSAYLLLGLIRMENKRGLGRIALALVITGSISTLPWLLVNASEHRAVARFEHLLKMDPDRAAHGYEILACYFRDKGDHEEALALWKKAIEAKPLPRYFGSLGNAYRKVGNLEKAVEAYYRSLEAGSDMSSMPGVYNNLGNTLSRMGRYDEAASNMKKAIELRPDKVEYYFNLGNILGLAERYEEAAPYFEATIKLEPGNVRAYKLLGITYARIGDEERAKSCLEQYLRFMPKDGPQIQGIIDSIQIQIETGR